MAEPIIGYAALQIIPSLQGIGSGLDQQLTGPLVAAGRSAGQAAGQAVATGLEQARAAVERASAQLAAARDKEADAVGKVRVAEAKLEELRRKGNASASQLARAEEALATAQRNAARTAQATRTAVDNLARARADLANTTDDAAESEGRFSRALSAIGDRLGPAGKQMATFAAATLGAGTAMATVAEAISRESSVDLLAAQLGATPDLAAEYGRIAGELYKQGLGESFADVTQAVGAVQSAFTTLGTEGEASIDKVTERALNFSAIFGQEVPEVVQTTSQLIARGLAQDSTEAFDLLTTAMQRTTVAMRDEIPELINEYGTFFASLGFNGQEAFGLLVSASDQGKVAMDKVGDALKETGIRATDIGDTGAVDALKAIGLEGANIQNRLLAGGESAKTAFAEMIQGLLSIKDPGEQAAAAIALIGTPMEDLNKTELPAFLEAMSHAGESMVGFEGTADLTGQTLNDNTDNALKRVTRTIQDELVNALTGAAGWIEQNRGVAVGLGIARNPRRGAHRGEGRRHGIRGRARHHGRRDRRWHCEHRRELTRPRRVHHRDRRNPRCHHSMDRGAVAAQCGDDGKPDRHRGRRNRGAGRRIRAGLPEIRDIPKHRASCDGRYQGRRSVPLGQHPQALLHVLDRHLQAGR
ncbi:hypothetical protein Ntsu_04580 [Nocardia sp. IFM 10818]